MSKRKPNVTPIRALKPGDCELYDAFLDGGLSSEDALWLARESGSWQASLVYINRETAATCTSLAYSNSPFFKLLRKK